ncbi:MAG: R3H domain-containing nucleic acid-binding protein [Thermomicrobiales bacterium]
MAAGVGFPAGAPPDQESGLGSIAHESPASDRRSGFEFEVTDDLQDLLAVLPPHITERLIALDNRAGLGELIEIVMDLGRPPEARFQNDEVTLTDLDVSREDLRHVEARIGTFGDDNRAGIERTLHRISAIRNRSGEVVGLTCRIGRAVYGTIAIVADLVESGQSVLLLGRPGVGKTTMLRETARVLADELRKRVVVVDTSNEIAGDGDIPHPAIGRARRMQVPTPTAQHGVMIEAVENHMPQVVVIDEIGTELEALAARTIAERGVQLIGTAHGNSLENLMLNPTLSDLIGGIQSVTLSDEEARRRGTQKSILERKAPPTFNVMVEIVNRDEVIVHPDVASTVDALLRNAPVRSERRIRREDGTIELSRSDDARRDPSAHRDGEHREREEREHPSQRIAVASAGSRQHDVPESWLRHDEQRGSSVVDFPARVPQEATPAPGPAPASEAELAVAPTVAAIAKGRGTPAKPLRVFPFAISRNRLEQTIQQLRVPAMIVRDAGEADIVMTLKNAYRQKPATLRDVEARGVPVYVLRSNTATQMEHVLLSLFPGPRAMAAPSTSVAPTHPQPVDEPDFVAPVRGGGSKAPKADPIVVALTEAERAISAVMGGAPATALSPQSPPIRRMQHELAERYNLSSRSRGRDPFRHVEIYRRGIQ